MRTRRLLVFAYDYPPSLVGVRRTVKMIRYLRESGWQCAVVTVRPVCASGWDDAPLREVAIARPTVYRTGSLDPYRICMCVRSAMWPLMRRVYHGPSGGGSGAALPGTTGGIRARVMRFLRRGVFLPDDRIGWLPFAVAKGVMTAWRGKPDAIYSTSYPHTAHLVAGCVSSMTSIPWIADFRDGWTQNPAFFHPLTPLHASIQRGLERWVAQTADRVVTVSPPITHHLQTLRKPGQTEVETIYNGFDDEAIGEAMEPESTSRPVTGDCASDRFTLLYGGTFFGTRSPEILLRSVARVAHRRRDFRETARIVLHTSLDTKWHALIDELGVASLVQVRGFVSHREILAAQRKADALILVVDTGPGSEIIVTQKVFEYLASGRPVFALAGHGACREVLEKTGGAVIADPENAETASNALEFLFDAWREGRNLSASPSSIAPFHRRAQARRLAEILDDMIE